MMQILHLAQSLANKYQAQELLIIIIIIVNIYMMISLG